MYSNFSFNPLYSNFSFDSTFLILPFSFIRSINHSADELILWTWLTRYRKINNVFGILPLGDSEVWTPNFTALVFLSCWPYVQERSQFQEQRCTLDGALPRPEASNSAVSLGNQDFLVNALKDSDRLWPDNSFAKRQVI